MEVGKKAEKECNLLSNKETLTGNTVLLQVTSVRTHN